MTNTVRLRSGSASNRAQWSTSLGGARPATKRSGPRWRSAPGSELLDEQTDEGIDAVLLWGGEPRRPGERAHRRCRPAGRGRGIWLLTPKSGRAGYVEPSDIAEAVPTAGLAQTSAIGVGENWSGIRLISPKTAKAKR
ncbi:DUF3052 family protein [Streptomyces gardneri]|uniref:DUF3052 family protein n=1 Tax=Streptomyces gardneri TaxID=66892 RepID=UPI0033DE8CDE